jgi:Na+/proline symporter
LTTAKEAFDLILSIGAGTGLLYLLRWFWWRVNAWSEIAAMISSFLVAVGFFTAGKAGHPLPPHLTLIVSVLITTVVWVAVTLLTDPTAPERLAAFYRLVRPAGPGWRPVREATGIAPSDDSLTLAMLGWMLGVAFVYAALFGAGSFFYGRTGPGWLWLAVFVGSGSALIRLVPRIWGTADSGLSSTGSG